MEATKEGEKVVVFDLNGTLYNKSSKDEFYKYLCSIKPRKVGYYLQMMYYKLLLKIHKIRKTEFKENFFNYLNNLPPSQVEKYAAEFWKREYPANFNKELLQILNRHKKMGTKIFCATGGLELYVKPLFELYTIDGLFGTVVKYDGNTYKVQGLACKDDEKLRRLDKYFKGNPYKLIEAYSDSKEPILDRAEKSYLIEDGKILSYTTDEA
jgi:HAD superfamily phosphoserine phosphatase-like hydrolase